MKRCQVLVARRCQVLVERSAAVARRAAARRCQVLVGNRCQVLVERSAAAARRCQVLVWVLGLLLVQGVAAAQEAEAGGGDPALDLGAAVELALRQNPALQAELARRDEVLGAVREVRADAFPDIDLVSSWSRARTPSLLNSRDFSDIIELFPGFQPEEQELWDVGVELTQTLYSGGKVRAAVELAELVVDVTDAQLATARLDTAQLAAEAFLEIQAARRAAEAVQSQDAVRRAALEVVEARFELGDATELERLRSRAALASVAPLIARAEGRHRVAATRLRVVLGLAEGELSVVEPRDVSLPGAPDLEALHHLAERHRPELMDLAFQLEALARQRTIEVAEGRPQVEFRGRYAHQSRLPENLDDDLFADWRATVALSWSLFDGGRRKGRLAQIDSQVEQLRWLIRDLDNAVHAQVTEAWTNYGAALERSRAAGLSLEAAAEARRVATESFREGVAIQADLIDAQDQEIQAELESVEAGWDSLVALVRLRRAVGLLPNEGFEGRSIEANDGVSDEGSDEEPEASREEVDHAP